MTGIDGHRAAGLVRWLVERATRDGSTAVPVGVLAHALRAYGVNDSVRVGELVEEEDGVVALSGERAVALPQVALAEEAVAEGALRLSEGEQLSLVVGPPPDAADAATTVVTDGHQRSLADVAELLADVAPGQRLVLCGDPDALEPLGPGRPFTDLVASGLLPVTVSSRAAGSPLRQVLEAVRGGRLPPVPEDQREVVVVTCDETAQVLRRVSQLVTVSIPRLLGDAGCLVLAVREEGAAGATALRTLVDIDVATVHQSVGRRSAAVVLVLPAEAAGSLTRALLVSALSVADEHVSIVHHAGPALARAVSSHPHRPRFTRLPGLLRGMSV